jgi:hypothetical protein
MNTWDLRSEILLVMHKWYWVLVSILLGAFIGWLIGFILPAPYRATQDIYVGLNAHRATRDLYLADVGVQQFRNLDDFKNWQMEQLNSLALSDLFLTKTLDRLQNLDENWNAFSVPELRLMLTIAWRNTGDWHFSARADNPDLAEQAVTTWSEVVIEEVALAVDTAREMVAIDSEMQSISNALVDLEIRRVLLQETQTSLADLKNIIREAPADQPISPLTHWNLMSLVTNVGNWNSGWLYILESAPPTGSLPEEYGAWLDMINVQLETELSAIPAQIAALSQGYDGLVMNYAKAADASRGLSGNMEVGQIKSEPVQIEQLRPTAALILVGAFLGLSLWIFWWLIQITRKTA